MPSAMLDAGGAFYIACDGAVAAERTENRADRGQKEKVFSHAGGQSYWIVCQKSHQEAGERGTQANAGHDRAIVHSGLAARSCSGKDQLLEKDYIRHG